MTKQETGEQPGRAVLLFPAFQSGRTEMLQITLFDCGFPEGDFSSILCR